MKKTELVLYVTLRCVIFLFIGFGIGVYGGRHLSSSHGLIVTFVAWGLASVVQFFSNVYLCRGKFQAFLEALEKD